MATDTVDIGFIARQQEKALAEMQAVRREVAELRQRHTQALQGLDTLHNQMRLIPDGIEIGINARLAAIEERIDNLGRSLVLEFGTMLDERLAILRPEGSEPSP
ncbi:hypothetical protein [Devosia geojensis]|nr:hypothetical protein [Devosia geojensis]